MIGNDRYGMVEKTKEISSEFGNVQFVNRDADNFLVNEINYFSASRGLFDDLTICTIDGVLGNDLYENDFNEMFPKLLESQNIFIFRDEKISKAYESFIKKHSKIFYKFEFKKEEKREDVFAIVNAFANRDKKNTWLILRDLFEKGNAPEAINGMLLSKVRTLFATHNKYCKFTKDELLDVSKKLIQLYHNAHLGKVDYETGFESLIIKSL